VSTPPAPTAEYGFVATTGIYTGVSASAIHLPAVEASVGYSTYQPIGFTFNYEGIEYTNFTMHNDGFITFAERPLVNGGTPQRFFPLPNNGFRPIIAPLWDNLGGQAPLGSFALYEVTGGGGNRVLTVEWRNWQWDWSSTTGVLSFQVKLYEATGNIEFIYQTESGAVRNGFASIGIGSAVGSASGIDSFVAIISVNPPVASNLYAIQTINVIPPTGTIYRFTPPPPCSGTPTAGTILPDTQMLCSGSQPTAFGVTGNTRGVSGITYTWMQSTDNVTYSIAIGESSTRIYTPPVFGGITIYYKCRITCTNSGAYADTAPVTVNSLASPITQASSLTFSPTYKGTTANWTNGSGNGRVVFLSTTPIADPVNLTGVAALTLGNSVYGGRTTNRLCL
jgi:hypothetical protein